MTTRSAELLCDLAVLLRKYGPDAFDQLSKEIRSEEYVERLVQILDAAGSAGRRAGLADKALSRRKPSVAKDDLADTLVHLQTEDPERYKLVQEARRRLVDDRVLPRLSDLQRFAEREGLGPLPARRRESAVSSLLLLFAKLEGRSLPDLLSRLSGPVERSGSLRGWTDIILPRGAGAARAMRAVLEFAHQNHGQVPVDPAEVDAQASDDIALALVRSVNAGYLRGDVEHRPLASSTKQAAVAALRSLREDGLRHFRLTNAGRRALESDL